MFRGEPPPHRSSPVVGDQLRLANLECIEDSEDIVDDDRQTVLLRILWPWRIAEAAKVWRDNPKPGLDERSDLIPP